MQLESQLLSQKHRCNPEDNELGVEYCGSLSNYIILWGLFSFLNLFIESIKLLLLVVVLVVVVFQ